MGGKGGGLFGSHPQGPTPNGGLAGLAGLGNALGLQNQQAQGGAFGASVMDRMRDQQNAFNDAILAQQYALRTQVMSRREFEDVYRPRDDCDKARPLHELDYDKPLLGEMRAWSKRWLKV